MRKVRYFITEEADTITGTFEVSDTTTEEEIDDMVTAEVAVNIHEISGLRIGNLLSKSN